MSLEELAHASVLPDALADRLEESARVVGLPLRQLDLLGRDPETARAFVTSVREGRYGDFLAGIDWGRLRGS